ncbi:SpoIIE family protein phosphatase [Dactylosporangium matsuzakiense]|uniref:Transcription antitermination regulator n=1 Tax=Dactylosporangium matsuzakiense TaxID=53360 RepID=A0A9W6KL96_9ACTN|nr:SpoIIE family protein phosphatase [Dactylosporangium matsuzakiense]UWZ43574.1 SpoIIE family protein phosphatase [Dactylosporangium matsuzakiense]GLL04096.1 transcription antitermination regulator [Dactylosporangium matsuzakiense]
MADKAPAESGSSSAEPAEALAALVAKLRAELTGVRTAMRNRAVIEQAKGVLVERLGVTPDQGFDQLVRLSQRTNIKLIEVAAAIVGTTSPDPNAPDVVNIIDDELRQHVDRSRAKKPEKPDSLVLPQARKRASRTPEVEALQSQHQLLSARIAAARSYDEICDVLGTAPTAWPAPTAVLLTLLDPDGAQRGAGTFGIPGEVRTQWSRIPPDRGLPLVVAAQDLETLWLAPEPEARRRFPVLGQPPFGGETLLASPLISGERVLGGILMTWTEGLPDTDELRRYVAALLEPVARQVDTLIRDEIASAWFHVEGEESGQAAPAQVWLPTVVDALHDPAALLSAVHEDGQLVDFRVEYANGLARQIFSGARVDPDEATLLAAYPALGSATLLPEFARVLQDGQPRRLDGLRADPRTDGVPGPQTLSVHAVRLWDRVFAVWRVATEADLLYDQLLQAERIAGIGSFCWELRDPEPRCSPELVALFHRGGQSGGREPARGAGRIPVAELTASVHPDDLLAVQDAVRRTIVEGKQLLAEIRGAGRVNGRRLRLTAEPIHDDTGNVTAVRGTVQDVTEERAIEARLRRAEEALAAQRHRLADERRAAEALQKALLPTDPELGHLEGVEICGRCRSPERVGTIDGDWFDATPVGNDGGSILVLGDVDERGLSSMTTAARLRYAVRAYAMLDMAPGDILTAVNTMLCQMETEHTACLIVARYTPTTRTLQWAAAGQVAPIRYAADGRGEVLSGPLGLPLGEVDQMRYTDTAVTLAPGDRVLFYTGGNASIPRSRADRRRGGGLELVRRAGETIDMADFDAVVNHLMTVLNVPEDEDVCAMLVHVP